MFNLNELRKQIQVLSGPYEGPDFLMRSGAVQDIAEAIESYAIDEDAPLMRKAAAMLRVLANYLEEK